MKERRKAISYIRLSTEAQLKGHSLARQKKLAEENCSSQNLELVEELRDVGVSGFSGVHREKGRLGLFFESLRSNSLDHKAVLLVENLDRLSRQDPLTAMLQFAEILKYGIEIHTLFDGQIYTKDKVSSDMGLLMLSVGQMMRAYDESKTKSRRLSAAWEKKRNDRSRILTSKSPSWIKPTRNSEGVVSSFTLIEAQANVVRSIFELTIERNMGSYAITRHLNSNPGRYPKSDKDLRSGSNEWSESFVKKVLKSPTVFGQFQPMKMVDGLRIPACDPINDYYPAVISEADFKLAQERIHQRTINGRGRKGKRFPNLFTGLLKCSKCKSSLRYRDRGTGPKATVTLQCSAALQNRKKCNAKAVKYQAFEDLFFSVISDLSLTASLESQTAKEHVRKLELKVVDEKSDLKRLTTKLDLLTDELLDPGLSDSIKTRLRDRLNQLDKQIGQAENAVEAAQAELEKFNYQSNSQISSDLKTKSTKQANLDRGSQEAADFRRDMNHTLKKIIDVIYVDNSPSFHIEDIREELYSEDDLSDDFLDWFKANKNERWKYQSAIEFVASEYGFQKHQEFMLKFYIHFKNLELRGVLHDGLFFRIDRETGKDLHSSIGVK